MLMSAAAAFALGWSSVSTPTHNHGPVDVTDIVATASAVHTTAVPLTTGKLATSVNWSVGQFK